MKLFISYARVDKSFCIQIVNMLDVHDTWFDQRLYAGQHWWKEILRRLDWCEGFVYLLSPESVASEYCRREFELAMGLGRHIFPVLIHEGTDIPAPLRDIQYADMSKGLTGEAVKTLLNAIYSAERGAYRQPSGPTPNITPDAIKPPVPNLNNVISVAAAAMERGEYDQAVYVLKQAKAAGYKARFINLDALLAEAEAGLERQAYLRDAERDYRPIADLIRVKKTFKLGCEAFQAFRQQYPDYDPECLALLCEGHTSKENSMPPEQVAAPAAVAAVPAPAGAPAPTHLQLSAPPPVLRAAPALLSSASLPLLEWCEIAPGPVRIKYVDDQNTVRDVRTVEVKALRMARYPVTNAQYQVFLNDPSGYANVRWWQYSPHARQWRINNPQPKPSSYKGDERPRERVSWYDALAFCHWLGARLGCTISLPTLAQWQRAAKGDSDRLFPWGDTFDPSLANTRESSLNMTTLVTRYPGGAGPFGTMDMAGNVWEWCLDAETPNGLTLDIAANAKRAIQGGSFLGGQERAQIALRYCLKPETQYASIGFRVVMLP
ncbi:MAG: SUMF1/EgtB/PvdO family nonheme iron enzyme [Aggregatilineales bacterium]